MPCIAPISATNSPATSYRRAEVTSTIRHGGQLARCRAAADRYWRRLLNDLRRLSEHLLRDAQAERLRCLQIDREVEHGRLLDWNLAGLRAFDDLVHERRRAMVQVVAIRSVAEELATSSCVT